MANINITCMYTFAIWAHLCASVFNIWNFASHKLIVDMFVQFIHFSPSPQTQPVLMELSSP